MADRDRRRAASVRVRDGQDPGVLRDRSSLTRYRLLLMVGFVLVLTACAAGANEAVGIADVDGGLAGFWLGFWHGLIAPITLLISLFKDGVNVYEVHNNGNWYDFGFVFAIVTFLGGSHGARKR